jgi:hypothetical protein
MPLGSFNGISSGNRKNGKGTEKTENSPGMRGIYWKFF